jgi:hypothetical protein
MDVVVVFGRAYRTSAKSPVHLCHSFYIDAAALHESLSQPRPEAQIKTFRVPGWFLFIRLANGSRDPRHMHFLCHPVFPEVYHVQVTADQRGSSFASAAGNLSAA